MMWRWLAVLALAGCGSTSAGAVATVAATSSTVTPVEATAAVYNPQVIQSNIATTICRSGFTKTIRPPTSYTTPIKKALIAKLPASASHSLADYELDHVVPLEVGGSPANPANLALELWPEARMKDKVENRVHDEVCAGKISLAVGRRCFVTDWKVCP